MAGKNFSGNNTGKRKLSDLYETPYSLTRLLLDRVRLRGTILEPARGNGAICKVLTEHGYAYESYDLETDFLIEARHFSTVITNPPYSLSMRFIEQAKAISDNCLLLLPVSYLHGKERYDRVYTDTAYPLKSIYVFTRYPLLGELLREDGKHHTGMVAYAWYWFDKAHSGSPEIQWLDNNDFVLRKGE